VPHVFQNLGDGTYFHSGYLAIRAAVAAKVNITYKILYNDAVAMTGGQPVDGQTSVPMIAQQMAAEGVKRIALVTEDLSRYTDRSALPPSSRCTTARTWMPCSASCANCRRVGADLRPDLRRRKRRRRKKANSLTRQAHGHQRSRVRRLRRLRHPVQLRLDPAAGNGIRPQAHHRPVVVQQGLLVRERLLPELRHGGRRRAEETKTGATRR
jgi:hypothetical protein